MQGLDLSEKVARMADPALKQSIRTEAATAHHDIPGVAIAQAALGMVFPLRDPPSYEQPYDVTPQAVAGRSGRDPAGVFYDMLLEEDGMRLCDVPFLNYVDYNYAVAGAMMRHPRSVFGPGDGGAHCGVMLDASLQTCMLTHCCRDRDHDRMDVEFAIKKMTAEPAAIWGLQDRSLHHPEFWHDLPDNARRLVQRADGYRATIVSGEVVMRDGKETGARHGALIRGAQAGPNGRGLNAPV